MEGLPEEILSDTLKRLPFLQLGRMMMVSRKWNELLSDSSTFWRTIEIQDEDLLIKPDQYRRIFEAASERSNHSLETVKIINLNYDFLEDDINVTFPILSLLQLSTSLEVLDLHLHFFELQIDYPYRFGPGLFFFRISFPRLEHLNQMKARNLPIVGRAVPRKLSLFAVMEPPDFSQDDIKWLSRLQVLQ